MALYWIGRICSRKQNFKIFFRGELFFKYIPQESEHKKIKTELLKARGWKK